MDELAADVLVLTEFRSNARGLALIEALRAVGYPFMLYEDGFDKLSGVLAVSRQPIRRLAEIGPPGLPNRWLHFATGPGELEVLGIYLNGSLGPPETLMQKQGFWDSICASAERLLPRRAMILGDFNTGQHRIDEEGATFRCSASLRAVLDSGWVDVYRLLHGDRKVYSWWSTRRGFRLDHALATPALAANVRSAEYVTRTSRHVLAHDVPRPWPSDLGRALSDHAAMVVDLKL